MLMAPGHTPRNPRGDEDFGNRGQDRASSHGEGTQDGGQAEVALIFVFQMGTTTRSFLGRWIMPSWWPTPSGCLSGTQGLPLHSPVCTSLPETGFHWDGVVLRGKQPGIRSGFGCWLSVILPTEGITRASFCSFCCAVPCLRSGIFGERLPLRYYLSGGMVLSGLFTALFGLGYFWDIHVLWYFIVVQVCCAGGCPGFGTTASSQFFSAFQGLGWPSFRAGSTGHFHSLQNLAVHGVGVETRGVPISSQHWQLVWQHQPLPV